MRLTVHVVVYISYGHCTICMGSADCGVILCVDSVHVAKYISPACSMADSALSCGHKAVKKRDQTPVIV